jgi:hypothetical protein
MKKQLKLLTQEKGFTLTAVVVSVCYTLLITRFF